VTAAGVAEQDHRLDTDFVTEPADADTMSTRAWSKRKWDSSPGTGCSNQEPDPARCDVLGQVVLGEVDVVVRSHHGHRGFLPAGV